MKVELGETRRRGEVIETIVHDLTRVGHPPAASIFTLSDSWLVVPENAHFPVEVRSSFNDAIGYVERLIPDE